MQQFVILLRLISLGCSMKSALHLVEVRFKLVNVQSASSKSMFSQPETRPCPLGKDSLLSVYSNLIWLRWTLMRSREKLRSRSTLLSQKRTEPLEPREQMDLSMTKTGLFSLQRINRIGPIDPLCIRELTVVLSSISKDLESAVCKFPCEASTCLHESDNVGFRLHCVHGQTLHKDALLGFAQF